MGLIEDLLSSIPGPDVGAAQANLDILTEQMRREEEARLAAELQTQQAQQQIDEQTIGATETIPDIEQPLTGSGSDLGIDRISEFLGFDQVGGDITADSAISNIQRALGAETPELDAEGNPLLTGIVPKGFRPKSGLGKGLRDAGRAIPKFLKGILPESVTNTAEDLSKIFSKRNPKGFVQRGPIIIDPKAPPPAPPSALSQSLFPGGPSIGTSLKIGGAAIVPPILAGAAVNAGGLLTGSPERRDLDADAQQMLIDQGAIGGVSTQEKPFIDPELDATPKEQLAAITGKDVKSETLVQDIFADFTGQGPKVQQALTDSLKEATGIDLGKFGDLERSFKLVDESLNEAQKTQEQRLLQRDNKSERVRQLSMKAGCTDCMSSGEKAAYIIAGAIPLIASAVTGQRVDPGVLGKIGGQLDSALASDRSKRAAAEAQQRKSLLAAEKDLEQFDLRTIDAFGKLAKQREGQIDKILDARKAILEEASDIKKLTQDDMTQFNLSPGVNPNDIKAFQGTAAGEALTMDLANGNLERIENEFAIEGSSSRFAQFNLSNYIPTGGIRIGMINELIPEEFRQLAQAQLQFMLSQLRKESGAVINESEYFDFRNKAFVLPGDDPATIEQKKQFRRSAIAAAETEAGPGATQLVKQNYVLSNLKPVINELGGSIKGMHVILPDPDNPGQYKVGSAADLLKSLEGREMLDPNLERNLDRILRGL